MQLAMNASPQARRRGSVDCCNCSKQNSSICLDAAKAGVTLITVRQAVTTATSTYSGFTSSPPRSMVRWLRPSTVPVTPRCHQARGDTILQSRLASGYTLGNPSAAHHGGRSRPTADHIVCVVLINRDWCSGWSMSALYPKACPQCDWRNRELAAAISTEPPSRALSSW
jgi:hypothetical protein